MRVGYVLYRFPQVSQTFVRDEIWGLRSAGVEVEVMVLEEPSAGSGPSDQWAGPYRLIDRPGFRRAIADHTWWLTHRPSRYVAFLLDLAQTRERLSYSLMRLPTEARRWNTRSLDRLHTHFVWNTASNVSALARLLGCPPSVTVHAKDIYAQPRAVVKRRLDRFQSVVTVCHYNVGFLAGARIVSFGDSRVQVIPCCVASAEPRDNREVDVVAVGRLVDKKGFAVLLRALSLAVRDQPDLRAVIVGDGPDRMMLEALSRELGLDQNVRFVGSVDHDAALSWIASAKVFCLPARPSPDGDSDAMPVVIREAMARGVAVISTRLAGIPESVDDSVGWLVDPDSAEELGAAIGAAIGDSDERQRRGRRAVERARDLWNTDVQSTALKSLFSS